VQGWTRHGLTLADLLGRRVAGSSVLCKLIVTALDRIGCGMKKPIANAQTMQASLTWLRRTAVTKA
jgi:hypothetical protein